MCDYGPFHQSIRTCWPLVLRLRSRQPKNLTAEDWSSLQTLFVAIKCMRTGTLLVGNSKVLAHALPNLIPPVDREYTLKFLYGRGAAACDCTASCHLLEFSRVDVWRFAASRSPRRRAILSRTSAEVDSGLRR